jgi:hypothetical protein
MARRGGRKTRTRRRKVFSISNALFSLGFANILSNGIFKTNIMTFFLEGTGIGGRLGASGGGISLSELIQRPDVLGSAALSNAQQALPTMVIQSFGLAVAERVFKKLMAMPFRRINSGIVTPLLGRGVRF